MNTSFYLQQQLLKLSLLCFLTVAHLGSLGMLFTAPKATTPGWLLRLQALQERGLRPGRFYQSRPQDVGLNSYGSVLIQTSRLEAQGSSSQH